MRRDDRTLSHATSAGAIPFARLGSGMVAGGSFGAFDWAVLAALPLLGIVLAMLTARITVLSALRRML